MDLVIILSSGLVFDHTIISGFRKNQTLRSWSDSSPVHVHEELVRVGSI